ncbi:bifunctional diaminohydroxyphosphoribosylaminopyrimidine deaminase/5-amino-6-(5-phosphoribosylamino)uracil reductase RibD [Parashewanella spongiae]
MWSTFDRQMMTRALQLARKGRYTTRPNPNVGCVLTLGQKVIGEGFHKKAGEPHAEVHALEQAKSNIHSNTDPNESARGATAYVTLEPCSHFGRTPPCALALIHAKVSRVVVAVQDPNPNVAGKGIALLREAGIHVDVGLYQNEAIAVNDGFMKRMETGMPYVSVKVAASIDGKTALSNGISKWITAAASRRDVQRLRLRHCAIVTGINTVIEDDCSLNVRHNELGELSESLAETAILQPLRVVLDSNCQISLSAKLFLTKTPILLVSTQPYSAEFINSKPSHVECLLLPSLNGRVDLKSLFKHLGKDCNSVLIEAGATLAGAVIEQALADELWLYQAPILLGSQGRSCLTLPDYLQMSQTPEITLLDERKIGEDRCFRFKLTSKKL